MKNEDMHCWLLYIVKSEQIKLKQIENKSTIYTHWMGNKHSLDNWHSAHIFVQYKITVQID